MVADFKRSLFDMYKGHLEMISNIPEENQELPPLASDASDISIDDVLSMSPIPEMNETKPEQTSVFTPPSPEDFS